jgi:hypothetical protein
MDPDIQAGHQVKALILEVVNSWRNYKKRCLQGAVQVNTRVSFKCWRIHLVTNAGHQPEKK